MARAQRLHRPGVVLSSFVVPGPAPPSTRDTIVIARLCWPTLRHRAASVSRVRRRLDLEKAALGEFRQLARPRGQTAAQYLFPGKRKLSITKYPSVLLSSVCVSSRRCRRRPPTSIPPISRSRLLALPVFLPPQFGPFRGELAVPAARRFVFEMWTQGGPHSGAPLFLPPAGSRAFSRTTSSPHFAPFTQPDLKFLGCPDIQRA